MGGGAGHVTAYPQFGKAALPRPSFGRVDQLVPDTLAATGFQYDQPANLDMGLGFYGQTNAYLQSCDHSVAAFGNEHRFTMGRQCRQSSGDITRAHAVAELLAEQGNYGGIGEGCCAYGEWCLHGVLEREPDLKQ